MIMSFIFLNNSIYYNIGVGNDQNQNQNYMFFYVFIFKNFFINTNQIVNRRVFLSFKKILVLSFFNLSLFSIHF